MLEGILKRLPDNGIETLGNLSFPGFSAHTLELPWKNNHHSISCIPLGQYICKYTQSNRLTIKKGYPVFTYEVLQVPGRAGIRIHSANYFNDLLGCIALGASLADLNKEGQQDVVSSKDTITRFCEFLNFKDFELIIVSI